MSLGYLVYVKLKEFTITFSFQNSLFEKKHSLFIKTNRDFMKKQHEFKNI